MGWYGMGWYGMGWYGLVQPKSVGLGFVMVWYGLGWVGMGWYGLGWVGMGQVGMVWYGLGWVGLGWVGLDNSQPKSVGLGLGFIQGLKWSKSVGLDFGRIYLGLAQIITA